jgi:hypothetical protein
MGFEPMERRFPDLFGRRGVFRYLPQKISKSCGFAEAILPICILRHQSTTLATLPILPEPTGVEVGTHNEQLPPHSPDRITNDRRQLISQCRHTT